MCVEVKLCVEVVVCWSRGLWALRGMGVAVFGGLGV